MFNKYKRFIFIICKKKFVKQHNIFQIKLTQFINLKLIDDSFVKQITHAIKIKIIFEKHKKQL